MKRVRGNLLPLPKLTEMGAGAQGGEASLIQQGKEDACFSCFGKMIAPAARSDASCGQCPAWQPGHWGLAEFSAASIFLCLCIRSLNSTPSWHPQPLPHICSPTKKTILPPPNTKAPSIYPIHQVSKARAGNAARCDKTLPQFADKQPQPKDVKGCLHCVSSLYCVTNDHSRVD